MFQKTKTSRLVCIAAFTLLFYASKSNAIVGGVEFTSGNPAPSGIVKVQGSTYVGSACTGALIAKNIVITAGHCPGRYVTFQDGSTVELEGKYIRNHPNSKLVNGNPANGYDLMIIRLSQDAPEAMKPFDLNNENLTEGTQVTVAGFGETATDRADSDVLRWVDLPMTVFENSSYISDGKHELEAKLKDGLDTYAEIHAKGIMLFVTDGKKGLCMGDSGGPGYVLKNGRYQLVEVFSSMLAESASNMCEYGLYAGENVKFHGDWIKQTIDELNALK